MHDHVQAIDENEQQDQRGQQGHPNSWGEETSAVAGVGEICAVGQSKALNLHRKRASMKHNQNKNPQFIIHVQHGNGKYMLFVYKRFAIFLVLIFF